MAKLARSAWSNLKAGTPKRRKLVRKASEGSTAIVDVRTTATTIRALVQQAVSAIENEERTQNVDAARRGAVLDTLERINELALSLTRGR